MPKKEVTGQQLRDDAIMPCKITIEYGDGSTSVFDYLHRVEISQARFVNARRDSGMIRTLTPSRTTSLTITAVRREWLCSGPA